MRGLDLLTLPRVPQRPHRRDGLRSAEGHVDPAAPTAACTLGSQPAPGARVPAVHQRDEVRAIDRLARLHPQHRQRLLLGEPAAGSLRHLPVRGQVVVPALGRDGLALQVAGVPAASGRRDARCGHHMCDDPQRAEPANELHSARTAIAPPCIWSVLAVPGVRSGSRKRGHRVG